MAQITILMMVIGRLKNKIKIKKLLIPNEKKKRENIEE